jgi:2-iminobutanoate/2-iminopropanoate deaminase
VEAAGATLGNVVQCSVYANDPALVPVINDVYRRFFPVEPPARKLIFVSRWHGPFDVEVDCIAAL